MAKYRKKPVVIEALQLTETNVADAWAFMDKPVGFLTDRISQDKFYEYVDSVKRDGLGIRTLEGTMTAHVGDYIIKGIKGEFYPCKSDIFEQTYEKVK